MSRRKSNVQLKVRIPSALHRQLSETAKLQGISLNQAFIGWLELASLRNLKNVDGVERLAIQAAAALASAMRAAADTRPKQKRAPKAAKRKR